MVTFKEFQRSKVLLPWFVHCQLWGINTEHEDINRRVYSYVNGLYIDVCNDGTYYVQYGNTDESNESLEVIERIFWDDYVKDELRYLGLSEKVNHRTKIVVEGLFKEFLTIYECSGDISPEQQNILDNTLNSISTILIELIKQNDRSN